MSEYTFILCCTNTMWQLLDNGEMSVIFIKLVKYQFSRFYTTLEAQKN